jgi:hypothetical protein
MEILHKWWVWVGGALFGLIAFAPEPIARVAGAAVLIAGLMYFARAIDSKIDELTALKRRVEKLEKAVKGLYD